MLSNETTTVPAQPHYSELMWRVIGRLIPLNNVIVSKQCIVQDWQALILERLLLYGDEIQLDSIFL